MAFTVKNCLTARRRLYLKRFMLALLLLVLLVATEIAAQLKINLRASSSRYPPANVTQVIPSCNCSRNTAYSLTGFLAFNSTCSDEATFYTQGQNVVSVSFYVPGDNHRLAEFTKGIHLNLVAMRKYYPGYTMRVYTSYTPNGTKDPICKALCQYPDLFWCDIRKAPLLGDQSSNLYFMMWRFLPLGDPTVDIFLSRDLDSVITAREHAAVKDWLQLKEKKGIQLMRDKGVHGIYMLGGMWGAKNSWLARVTELQKEIVEKGATTHKSKGVDQWLLGKVIYLERPQDIVAYDSYSCKSFLKTMHRPFPTQRQMDEGNVTSDFVGNVAFGTEKHEFPKCPLECRPSYGKDWEYC